MPGRAKTVFLKEIRETLRDRRVILGVFISPLLVTPLIMVVVAFFAGKKVLTEQAEVLRVAVVRADSSPLLVAALEEVESLEVTEAGSREEAEVAVRSGEVHAALVVADGAAEAIARGGNTTAEILFDNARDRSRNAQGRLWDVLNRFKEKEVARRLVAGGLSEEILNPIRGTPIDLATPEESSGFLLGLILPYIVIVMASFGGMTTAFDICAGEKERGTMETLLVSPATRHEIVLGKLWAVSVVSIAAAFFAVCGIVLAFQGVASFVAVHAPELRAAVSYPVVAAMLVFVVPLAVSTSSLLLVVSAFARNQKEAQAYIFPFMIVIILPALLANFVGQDPAFAWSLAPILNTALAMKQVLIGTFDAVFLSTVVVSSAAYAAMMMKVAAAMFEREAVLFRA